MLRARVDAAPPAVGKVAAGPALPLGTASLRCARRRLVLVVRGRDLTRHEGPWRVGPAVRGIFSAFDIEGTPSESIKAAVCRRRPGSYPGGQNGTSS
jgi:hypothetical protein